MGDHEQQNRPGTPRGTSAGAGATRQRRLTGVPVGLERVLYLAAVEPPFRRRLLARRDAAVEARGLRLRPSELAMLRVVPEAQLRASIAGVDTSGENLRRRAFLRAVAAGALAVGGAEAFTGCDQATDGCRPPLDMTPRDGPPPDLAPEAGPGDASSVDEGAGDAGSGDTLIPPDSGFGWGARPGG